MPHSANLRWTEGGTKAVHLNSKGAKKFDSARSEALKKKNSVAEKMMKKYGGKGKGHFDERGGWHGNKVGGGKGTSGFEGRDNS